jgi:hypothetical protein
MDGISQINPLKSNSSNRLVLSQEFIEIDRNMQKLQPKIHTNMESDFLFLFSNVFYLSLFMGYQPRYLGFNQINQINQSSEAQKVVSALCSR